MREVMFSSVKNNLCKIDSCLLRKIGKILVYALALLGMMTLMILFILHGLLSGNQTGMVTPVPKNAIITLNFNQTFNETQNDSLFSELNDGNLTYFELIKNLHLIMFDDNVKAVLAKINITNLGLAQIQNLRNTIINLRQNGKKTYIFSSGMGNLGQGTDEYWLATAFDKIYMQPDSDLGITGIGIEIPFIGGALNKFGIDAEFYARYEYKNAAASLTHSQMPKEYRSQLNYLGSNIYQTLRRDIAKDRNIKEPELDRLINRAPLSAEEALAAKLIDGTAYYSELEQTVAEINKGKFISIEQYAANFSFSGKKLPTVAWLALEGTIIEGESTDSALSGELSIGSDTIIKNIKDIAQNKDIKALIVRINSPGGSYTAANAAWHELLRLKQKKNIPIIVSMGDYAASGGYFIALCGDKILAEPNTITGSIGVLGGKIVTAGLWQKLNVAWNGVSFGRNAGIISPNHKFSPTEKNAFNRMLDNVYKDFTQKVSAARNIKPDALDKIARGRIWLGKDAVKNGLIDDIGGITEALELAKKLGGIKPDEKFDILSYPQPKTLAEKINGLLRRSPQISINRLATEIGLDIQSLNVLKQMQYDCRVMPFLINK